MELIVLFAQSHLKKVTIQMLLEMVFTFIGQFKNYMSGMTACEKILMGHFGSAKKVLECKIFERTMYQFTQIVHGI